LKNLVLNKAGLYVFAPDLHFPDYDKPTFNAMLHFASSFKLAGFVFGGDQFNNNEISHHNKGKIVHRKEGSYDKNTVGFEKTILTPVEAAIGKASRTWIEGNHDDWENQLTDEQPELRGTIERRIRLGLDKRRWQYVSAGHLIKLGKLTVIHGETLTGMGNQVPGRHSTKALLAYSSSVLYGHIHSPQSDSRIAPFAQKDKHMAWCSPILGATNPAYLRNKPTAWVNGFTLVELRENGDFNVYPVVVARGRFTFAGVTYGA
jgi:hypothetical protein